VHKSPFVQGAAKKRRLVGWRVHIAAKGSIVRRRLSSLNKTLFMNQNTDIITAAVPVISSEAIQESIRDEKGFWGVYSRPEFPTLSSKIIE
jgi:hypothetical protein